MGFKKLGAKITDSQGYINATAKDLVGAEIFFDRPSHTGTENIMMAAALAKGTTTIINAACDPEVVDLANFLNKMGSKISGAGTTRMEITGVKRLHGVEYQGYAGSSGSWDISLAIGACGGESELSNASYRGS